VRLLISGSRDWRDADSIEAVIRYFREIARDFDEEFVLIHGHCPKGADALADQAGRQLGLKVGKDLIRVPADWDRLKRAAGVLRNQQMLDEQHPDVVVAFRAAGKSNGTDDMIARARKARVRTHIIREHADANALTRA